MQNLRELQREAALERRIAYLEKYGSIRDISEEFAKMDLTPFVQPRIKRR